ncbi:MAG: DUF2971 domain-containing protein [Sphingobacteriaceae bacterium]|nr:MAG: DUF2971 domain-containing protein [Sphingobacteriaceae bacterium]
MEIQFPNKYSLDELNNQFLWRYIGLHKLIDLVINNKLYFTRLDHFEDGLEGITGEGTQLKFFINEEPLTYENINDFDEKTQAELIEQDKNTRQNYLDTLAESQQAQFASCWFLGNKESIAMWKLYSQKDGVAIKFKARQLADSIIKTAESYTNSDFQILLYGPVEYKNIWPFDLYETFDNKFNALKKDKSYAHENEFRFIVVVPNDKRGLHQNFILPIGELSYYDIEIVTNPFMEKWEVENLKKLLEKFGLEKALTSSKMDIKH